jgi:molybdopterin converting factor small subunit
LEWGACLTVNQDSIYIILKKIAYKMAVHVTINLFATLKKFTPVSSDSYPIKPGITVKKLLEELCVPEDEVRLVFVDGVKHDLASILKGGERVGIFPAVGGG